MFNYLFNNYSQDLDEIFEEYSINEEYDCTIFDRSKLCTKLMYLIIKKEKLEYIKFYLENNPHEINLKNEKGYTALIIAGNMFRRYFNISNYNNELIKLLLHYGANIHDTNNDRINVFNGYCDKKTLKLLIDYNFNVNYEYNYGYTPLLKAIKGNYEIIKVLLDNGADINHINEFGRNAIIICVLEFSDYNLFNKLNLLINYGADFDQIYENKHLIVHISEIIIKNHSKFYNAIGKKNIKLLYEHTKKFDLIEFSLDENNKEILEIILDSIYDKNINWIKYKDI